MTRSVLPQAVNLLPPVLFSICCCPSQVDHIHHIIWIIYHIEAVLEEHHKVLHKGGSRQVRFNNLCSGPATHLFYRSLWKLPQSFNYSCWFHVGQITQGNTGKTMIFSKAAYKSTEFSRAFKKLWPQGGSKCLPIFAYCIIRKPSWGVLWWAAVSVISACFWKGMRQAGSFRSPPQWSHLHGSYELCLSSGFNTHECWETASNERHRSVGNTAWGPEIVSKAFQGYLIYPHMFATKLK